MSQATPFDSRGSQPPDWPPSQQPDLALAAQWLSAQFMAAPDAAAVRKASSVQGQQALRLLGECIGCEAEMDRLRRLLSAQPPGDLAASLQRRYTALFEGIFHQRGCMPYASSWDGAGRLCGPAVGRMQDILRQLDVHLAEHCREMPDHLGIQLAALAVALQRDNASVVRALLADLGWTDSFAAALLAADGEGFYATLAQVLMILLDKVRLAHEDTPQCPPQAQPAAVA